MFDDLKTLFNVVLLLSWDDLNFVWSDFALLVCFKYLVWILWCLRVFDDVMFEWLKLRKDKENWLATFRQSRCHPNTQLASNKLCMSFRHQVMLSFYRHLFLALTILKFLLFFFFFWHILWHLLCPLFFIITQGKGPAQNNRRPLLPIFKLEFLLANNYLATKLIQEILAQLKYV